MGYTHYWYRNKTLNKANFARVVEDFKKVIPTLEHVGVRLASYNGDGTPQINNTEISFNGVAKCGHEERELGITWPSDKANGVASVYGRKRESNIAGSWFAGLKLDSRTCGGKCSHESFLLKQIYKPGSWQQNRQPDNVGKTKDKYFAFCMTAYKPYDLAVNICLIIAKHYFGNEILVYSDGELKDWKDAMQICQHFLGYGEDFQLDTD